MLGQTKQNHPVATSNSVENFHLPDLESIINLQQLTWQQAYNTYNDPNNFDGT